MSPLLFATRQHGNGSVRFLLLGILMGTLLALYL